MKPRCKPGDLAILLCRDSSRKDAYGRIVLVEHEVRKESFPGTWWRITFVHDIPLSVRCFDIFHASDHVLVPIRPEGIPDEECNAHDLLAHLCGNYP